MTSRERITRVLSGRQPDRIPVDFGGCSVTGMHVSVVYALRQALGLDRPGTPVGVNDPFQMLGEIGPDLTAALGIDTVALEGAGTFFGFRKDNWKPWQTPDGTPVLVPGAFNTEPNPDGSLYQYPQGDRTARPSGLMPAGGLYFDTILRHDPSSGGVPCVEDNTEEFSLIPDAELSFLGSESRRLHAETDRAVFGSFPGAGFGDMAWLPAPFLKSPKGVRDYDEWLVSLVAQPDFVRQVFESQCQTALANLERYHGAVGERIAVVFVSGADYGTQHAPLISPSLYRELFLPFYRRVNDWIHYNTTWRTFVHSCGAIEPLIEGFIEAGFDVLNPVQISACGMDPRQLKSRFGAHLVFWGGGADTQRVLPFASPAQVREHVLGQCEILSRGGGFVFNAVHNIQPRTPVDNILAMFDAVREFNGRS